MTQLQTVLITGANRGIGYEFAKHYKSLGHRVIVTSRSPLSQCKDLAALVPSSDHVQVDVSDINSIKNLATFMSTQDTKIDLLILNAGLLVNDSLDSTPEELAESMMNQYKINTIAPVVCTKVLLPYLPAEAKVVATTSRMGSIADNGSGAFYGYRSSKTALNMSLKSLSIDLKEKGIHVLALHPGFIATEMTGGKGEMGPAESVSKMVGVIEKLDSEMSGQFIHRDGFVLPW